MLAQPEDKRASAVVVVVRRRRRRRHDATRSGLSVPMRLKRLSGTYV